MLLLGCRGERLRGRDAGGCGKGGSEPGSHPLTLALSSRGNFEVTSSIQTKTKKSTLEKGQL